jgi:hypothetical protein
MALTQEQLGEALGLSEALVKDWRALYAEEGGELARAALLPVLLGAEAVRARALSPEDLEEVRALVEGVAWPADLRERARQILSLLGGHREP